MDAGIWAAGGSTAAWEPSCAAAPEEVLNRTQAEAELRRLMVSRAPARDRRERLVRKLRGADAVELSTSMNRTDADTTARRQPKSRTHSNLDREASDCSRVKREEGSGATNIGA